MRTAKHISRGFIAYIAFLVLLFTVHRKKHWQFLLKSQLLNINAFRFFPQNRRFTYLSSVSLFKDKYPFIPRKPKLFVKKDNYIIIIIATAGTFGFCGDVRMFFSEGGRVTQNIYLLHKSTANVPALYITHSL